MKKNRFLLATLFLVVIPAVAMAKPSPQDTARRQAILKDYKTNPPACQGDEDCAAKWSAAQQFVTGTASYKIKTTTSTTIATYPSPVGETGVAMTVTKRPNAGNKKYKFDIDVRCGAPDPGQCDRDLWSVMADFKHTLEKAKP
ncbi:MAG: hypothetical protein QM647_07415 [Asticcacaulis sp.]